MIDIVGLDSGGVLLRKDGEWQIAALRRREGSADDTSHWKPSHQILTLVSFEKRTFWQSPGQVGSTSARLAGVQAVVTAPLLDGQGNVIGALYGDRMQGA